MRKILLWIATILQILFLVTAYGIHVFSTKKMGLTRYLVYINNKWEEVYPVHELQYFAIALFLVLAVIILIKYIRKKKNGSPLGKLAMPMTVSLIIITIAFIILTLVFSTESFRSYYFVTLLLGVATFMQHIKVFFYLNRASNRIEDLKKGV